MSEPSIEKIEEVLTAPRRFFVWLLEELRWFVRAIISSTERFYWDNGFSKAASLAYTTLLSLVPITALLFGILASFILPSDSDSSSALVSSSTMQSVDPSSALGSPEKQKLEDIRQFIFRQFLPNMSAVDQVLSQLQTASTIVSQLNVLAIAFLVFTSILLLNSIEAMLNEVWQVYEPRSIANRVKIFCAILVVGPVLAASAYFFADFSSKHITVIGINSRSYSYLLQFLIDYLAFFLLYFLVPKAPVKFSSASFGAFIASILFGLGKASFVVYVEKFASYKLVYGAVAAIPIFLIWLYFGWSIVLYGAEASYQAQYLPRKGKVWKRTVLSVGDGLMLLAVQSLVIIGRAFRDGRRLPNDWELAEALGCSSTVLRPALISLERAGIIVRGDSDTMPLTLLCSPERITLDQIREALYSSRSSMRYGDEMSALFSAFGKKNKESESVTLADLIAFQ